MRWGTSVQGWWKGGVDGVVRAGSTSSRLGGLTSHAPSRGCVTPLLSHITHIAASYHLPPDCFPCHSCVVKPLQWALPSSHPPPGLIQIPEDPSTSPRPAPISPARPSHDASHIYPPNHKQMEQWGVWEPPRVRGYRFVKFVPLCVLCPCQLPYCVVAVTVLRYVFRCRVRCVVTLAFICAANTQRPHMSPSVQATNCMHATRQQARPLLQPARR